jgi:Uma2 family endonuclease
MKFRLDNLEANAWAGRSYEVMALPLEIKVADRNRRYTTAEFMALELDPGKCYELVRGVLEEMGWPGERHGLVTDNLYAVLGAYIRVNRLGRVLVASGFNLAIDPERDTVRSPDLTFLAKGKVSGQSGAVSVAPDLAVEVLSPSDRPGKLKEKLQDYQLAGWDLIWVINPDKETVEIYRLKQGLNPMRTLSINDQLEGEDVIPGFRMSVAALFDYED